MKQNKSERVIVNVRIRPFTDDERKKDPSTPFDQVDTKRNILTSILLPNSYNYYL